MGSLTDELRRREAAAREEAEELRGQIEQLAFVMASLLRQRVHASAAGACRCQTGQNTCPAPISMIVCTCTPQTGIAHGSP
jgi:hypothetical protein